MAAYPALLDRDPEKQALDRLLEDVRGGRSAVLVIRGEAGIGKTALLRHCTQAAAGFRVTLIAAVESEMELPYAAVHQLCLPMLDRIAVLPAPQQAALRVAFGMEAGDAPNRFLVALAVLGLLSEVAAEHPLLCIVDDAQWLDATSAQILGFVGRRLHAESVGLVTAARPEGPQAAAAGLPELELRGLPADDARILLTRSVAGPLDEAIRERLIAETRGNPLALLELARERALTERPGEHGPLPPEALLERIERSFLQQLDELPDEARRLLLVAAAEPTGDTVLFWRAAARFGLGPSVVLNDMLNDMRALLTVGDRVTFRHPLVRSAVYRAAAPDARRAVHLALADVTDPATDADRRAWHLAAAAAGPDEEVAAELERSAGRAQARGGVAAAAAFLRRSFALTRDPARRTERALAAARASLEAGAFDAARASVATAEAEAQDERQRALADLLHGQIALASGLGADAPPLLLKAAKRFESLDVAVARETYVDACGAALFAGSADALAEVARAARALPPSPGEPRAVDLLLDGMALLIAEGRFAAVSTLLQAGRAFAGDGATVEEGLRWGWMATAGTNALWDNDTSQAIPERQIEIARDRGALAQVLMYHMSFASAVMKRGDFARAELAIAEGQEIADATNATVPPFSALQLAAFRGSEAKAVELIRTLKQAAEQGRGLGATVADWTASMLYNGLGRHEEALDAARRASSAGASAQDFASSIWSLPELVEAATRCGQPSLARDAFERLKATTQPAGTGFGLGVEARSQALVSEGEEAEALFRTAIERLGRARMRPDLARAHLLYGEWLLAGGTTHAAREQLRTAYDEFTTMGMQGFAERARRARLGAGERVRAVAEEAPGALTPQESQIARLASEGLSNPEIGGRLFLSPRTVEYHLRKVFAKLGISSRRQLRGVRLDGRSSSGPS